MENPLRSRLITSLYSAFICSSVFTEPTLRPSFPPFSIYCFLPDSNRQEILSRSNCAQVESVAIIIGAKTISYACGWLSTSWQNRNLPHAENLSMRARFNGHAPKGQKFIAQRQAKRRPGYNVPLSLRPVRAKVLKQSVLYLLLPLQGVVWYGVAVYPGYRFACPGLWRSLGFQPAWIDRAMRYHDFSARFVWQGWTERHIFLVCGKSV